MKSWKKPTSETVDRALALIEKETDRQHFFYRLKNPQWIQPLSERDCFKSPPAIRYLPDGYVQYPSWPELEYLKNISQEAPEEVIRVVLELPAVDNPRVYDDILDIALSLNGEQSARLKPKMLEYARIEHQFLSHRYHELIVHWVAENQIQAALELVEILIQFRPDPKAEEKAKERREDSYSFIMLEPTSKIREWDYQELLDKGVRPLADKIPVQVARMLIEATASMIRLRKSQDELESGSSQDEWWCSKLNEQSQEHQDPKENLVHALVYTCEKVYEHSPNSIVALDNSLRNQRWDVFKRLRQYLYALHLNELTKPWIRELILEHGDYAKQQHHYEFQQMIQLSCEHFGAELLTEDERTQIFDAILSGPPMENYREYRKQMGEEFTETDSDQLKHNFHHKQLRPFASVLFGEYATYFEELKSDDADEITDETYLPFHTSEVRTITSRSPKSSDELSKLLDEELLNYINEWQDEHRDRDDWSIEVNISALAGTFQSVFTESITSDNDRLAFWIEKNRERIERPIYARHMIRAMRAQVEGGDLEQCDRWFDFCKWVLSHSDEDHEKDILYSETLRENPSWRYPRRTVCDFVEVCLKQEVNVPISAREQLAELLEMLCTQFDWALERDQPVLLNRDPLTEAINTTRGLALDNLDNFVSWVHRHDDKAKVHEVIPILEKRFRPEAEYPLTIPEYAILGMNYWRICQLNQEWAAEHRSDFFPQGNIPAWQAAFGNFLRYNRPYKPAFDIVRDEFEFALEHLDYLKQQNQSGRKAIDALGEHIFLYYLWEVYPLRGDGSLLERFYQKSDNARKHWATLFDNVGRQLERTNKQHLNESLKNRTLDFFEWRLEVGEPLELGEFTFWLKAECLEAEWRLEAYFETLDVPNILDTDQNGQKTSIYLSLQSLHTMLPEYTPQVVECFAKLIHSMPQDRSIFASTDEARAILKAGFDHDDESVRKTAKDTQENLLSRGYLSFLDLDA